MLVQGCGFICWKTIFMVLGHGIIDGLGLFLVFIGRGDLFFLLLLLLFFNSLLFLFGFIESPWISQLGIGDITPNFFFSSFFFFNSRCLSNWFRLLVLVQSSGISQLGISDIPPSFFFSDFRFLFSFSFLLFLGLWFLFFLSALWCRLFRSLQFFLGLWLLFFVCPFRCGFLRWLSWSWL